MHTKFCSESLKRKRLLRSHRRRREDIIKMDLKEIVWNDVDWMRLAEDTDQW
jgi:hypothetical protein